MKFSNITYGFYPNDEDLLSLYKDLPEDLVDISDEDYLAFRSGDIGPLVHIIDGKLETRTIEIPLTQEQIESKSKSNVPAAVVPVCAPGFATLYIVRIISRLISARISVERIVANSVSASRPCKAFIS